MRTEILKAQFGLSSLQEHACMQKELKKAQKEIAQGSDINLESLIKEPTPKLTKIHKHPNTTSLL